MTETFGLGSNGAAAARGRVDLQTAQLPFLGVVLGTVLTLTLWGGLALVFWVATP